MKNGSAVKGKTCLVTGANSGVGKFTAIGLAKFGVDVVMVCRDKGRGEAAQKEIIEKSGSKNVDLMLCDLSSQKQIRKFAEDFKGKYKKLHVFVNNAGLMIGERKLTEDGIETTFAVNHLAYFLLTHLLLGMLKENAPSRIVNVSSMGHRFASIYFDDLMMEKKYSDFFAYNQSKLANIMFTYELARRLDGTGVTANCLHPGGVATNFGNESAPVFRFLLELGKITRIMVSPEKGARTSVYLASSPDVEGVSGKYFDNSREKKSSRRSYDMNAQKKLWELSEKLTGLAK